MNIRSLISKPHWLLPNLLLLVFLLLASAAFSDSTQKPTSVESGAPQQQQPISTPAPTVAPSPIQSNQESDRNVVLMSQIELMRAYDDKLLSTINMAIAVSGISMSLFIAAGIVVVGSSFFKYRRDLKELKANFNRQQKLLSKRIDSDLNLLRYKVAQMAGRHWIIMGNYRNAVAEFLTGAIHAKDYDGSESDEFVNRCLSGIVETLPRVQDLDPVLRTMLLNFCNSLPVQFAENLTAIRGLLGRGSSSAMTDIDT